MKKELVFKVTVEVEPDVGIVQRIAQALGDAASQHADPNGVIVTREVQEEGKVKEVEFHKIPVDPMVDEIRDGLEDGTVKVAWEDKALKASLKPIPSVEEYMKAHEADSHMNPFIKNMLDRLRKLREYAGEIEAIVLDRFQYEKDAERESVRVATSVIDLNSDSIPEGWNNKSTVDLMREENPVEHIDPRVSAKERALRLSLHGYCPECGEIGGEHSYSKLENGEIQLVPRSICPNGHVYFTKGCPIQDFKIGRKLRVEYSKGLVSAKKEDE